MRLVAALVYKIHTKKMAIPEPVAGSRNRR